MSDQFRQVRQLAGITVTQLAQESGVSRATIEKIEGNRAVRMEYAARLVRTLNTLAGSNYTVEELNILTSR